MGSVRPNGGFPIALSQRYEGPAPETRACLHLRHSAHRSGAHPGGIDKHVSGVMGFELCSFQNFKPTGLSFNTDAIACLDPVNAGPPGACVSTHKSRASQQWCYAVQQADQRHTALSFCSVLQFKGVLSLFRLNGIRLHLRSLACMLHTQMLSREPSWYALI